MLSEDYAASFQEYFDAYYEEILKYCYIHLGYNQTHAQECCQEVFLLCLQKQCMCYNDELQGGIKKDSE